MQNKASKSGGVDPNALNEHLNAKLWKATPVFSSEFVTGNAYEHPLVLLPPQERALSRPNSPPTALDLLSREGGERPRNSGALSSSERASLMPRFDPFPARSNFNPGHLKPLKAPKRLRRGKSPNRDGDEPSTAPPLTPQTIAPLVPNRRLVAKPEGMAEVKLYVDTNILRRNLQTMAFPLNGNLGVTKITLQQLVYCARVHDYVESIVSAKFMHLLTALMLTMGGNAESDQSSMAVTKVLKQISATQGFQSTLVEQNILLPASVAILLGPRMRDPYPMNNYTSWSAIRGYGDGDTAAPTTSFLDYSSKSYDALEIIGQLLSKPSQKYLKAANVWKKLVLRGGCLHCLFIEAADAAENNNTQEIHLTPSRRMSLRGSRWQRVHDLCEKFLDGVACDERLCRKLHLVGVHDAGGGIDKTGRQTMKDVFSRRQLKARAMLDTCFQMDDFLHFYDASEASKRVLSGQGDAVVGSDLGGEEEKSDERMKVANEKLGNIQRLLKMKLQNYFDNVGVSETIKNSYRQTIERRRRQTKYSDRIEKEREMHKLGREASTKRKVDALVAKALQDTSPEAMHPIKAVSEADEFHNRKNRVSELISLYLADRVTFRSCKYRNKLEKGVRIVLPHAWTTEQSAAVWRRKHRAKRNRPPKHRCKFCFRDMKDAKKASQWFLGLTSLGLDFFEWVSYVPTSLLRDQFTELSHLVSTVRETSQTPEEAGEKIGAYLSNHKVVVFKFGAPTVKKGSGKGYVDAKLMH